MLLIWADNDHVGTAALGCPGERSSPVFTFAMVPNLESNDNLRVSAGHSVQSPEYTPRLRSFAPPDSRGRLSPH